MILTKRQIEEIEAAFLSEFETSEDFRNLLETVKALRQENEEQRKLLKEVQYGITHKFPDDSGWTEIAKQIEEHLK